MQLSLNLSGNQIDDDLFKFLVQGLTLNISLVELNLSHNKIGDQGARRLSKFLIKNEILVHLNLSNNSIGYDGSRYIAQALKINRTLETLSLKLNSLNDKAGAKLFKDLAFNTKLKRLDLEANSFGGLVTGMLCRRHESSAFTYRIPTASTKRKSATTTSARSTCRPSGWRFPTTSSSSTSTTAASRRSSFADSLTYNCSMDFESTWQECQQTLRQLKDNTMALREAGHARRLLSGQEYMSAYQ